MRKTKKKTKAKSVKPQTGRIMTLSRYNWGQHTLDPSIEGSPSFLESMLPFMDMARELIDMGVQLGSRIKITMQVQK